MAMLVMLQSCLILHGCSLPADSAYSSEQALYSSKCGSCHRLIEPREHPPRVWEEYVYKYGKAMPEQQQRMLIDYLGRQAIQ